MVRGGSVPTASIGVMGMTVEQMVARLRTRADVGLTPEQLRAADDLVKNAAAAALVSLLAAAIDNRTLQPEEIEPALELALAGRLLKSSDGLAAALVDYMRMYAA